MKLKIYDASLVKKQLPGAAQLRINFKSGSMMISQTGGKLMKVKEGDQVKIAYDEEHNEWYIFKDKKDGFLLRRAHKKTNYGSGLMFNSKTTVVDIANSTKFKGDTALVKIAPEPVNDGKQGSIDYWLLRTSSLENK